MKSLFKSRLVLFIALVGITFSCKKNESGIEGNYNQNIDTAGAIPDSIGTVTDSTVMGNKNMKTTTNSDSPNTYNGAGATNSSGINDSASNGSGTQKNANGTKQTKNHSNESTVEMPGPNSSKSSGR